MNLQEWRERRKETQDFLTPSGLVVKLKRLTLLDLVEQGEIPVPLAGIVNRLLQENVELDVDNHPEFAPAIDLVARACIVDPLVADEPDEKHLGIKELPAKDRLAIYTWANQESTLLLPFRQEPEEPAGAAPGGDELREAPQRDSRDNGRVDGLSARSGDPGSLDEEAKAGSRKAGKKT